MFVKEFGARAEFGVSKPNSSEKVGTPSPPPPKHRNFRLAHASLKFRCFRGLGLSGANFPFQKLSFRLGVLTFSEEFDLEPPKAP